jgi:transketolase
MIVDSSLSMREAYGDALVGLGEQFKNFVVLDADLSKGTHTYKFGKQFPERFFNVGIAEQNEMSIAAGIASTGKIVFASTYCVFASMRALDQIRNMISYPKLNVKIIAANAGISIGEDGVTHQAIEDIAIMRSIPNLTVVSPADAEETKRLIQLAYKKQGPMYFRLGRLPWPVISHNEKYELGRGIVLCEGQDATIIATGHLVWEAFKASEVLKELGISTTVINIHTIKPIDEELIVRYAEDTKVVVTAEEHNIIGGLGSAVAEILVEKRPVNMIRIGIKDIFTESGNGMSLLEKYCLTRDSIVEAVKKLLSR